jgi:hypothetical protein
MTPEFTNIEIQLIRASLATKTDADIAEILERPVERVRDFINQITEGGAEARELRILDVKMIIKNKEVEASELRRQKELNLRKRQQEARNRHVRDTESAQREEKIEKENNRREANEVQRKREKTAWEERKSYKTRVIDWSKMKSVRVSKNTYVWVDKSVKDKDAIDKYYANLENNKHKTEFEKDLNQKMNSKNKTEQL